MKRPLMLISFAALTVLLPAVPVMLPTAPDTAAYDHMPQLKEYIFEEEYTFDDTPYRILNCSTGEISEVSVRDYVIGAVAAEMPASFEVEALKAQAVAAHTYAERQRKMQREHPDPALGNADLSDDPNKYQGFFTDELIRRYFGENYEKNYKKIADAVDDVLPYVIVYEDEPIIAAFHSMSSGQTESAENVWGTAVEYLVPADSRADTQAPGYISEKAVPLDFARARLERAAEGAELGDDPEKWIEICSISPSGTVLEAKAGGITVSGGDIRDAFGLRSANFTTEVRDDELIFTTKGYGHGVGMSQYGANDMAKHGKTWQEILEHYYKRCALI